MFIVYSLQELQILRSEIKTYFEIINSKILPIDRLLSRLDAIERHIVATRGYLNVSYRRPIETITGINKNLKGSGHNLYFIHKFYWNIINWFNKIF